MSDTCGLLFTDSSPSAVLQRVLESRLRARMDVSGSPEYSLTWKRWAIGQREPICALRASARRTSASGCIGWPTARAEDSQSAGMRHSWVVADTLTATARCVQGWQTPNAMDVGAINRGGDRNHELLLGGQVKSVQGWPTPNLCERGPESVTSKAARGSGGVGLQTVAQTVAGWATPVVRDHRNSAGDGTNPRDLPRQCGTLADSSSAESLPDREARARCGGEPPLNPLFSLWLMGYPVEWASCGERATRSCRTSRRSS